MDHVVYPPELRTVKPMVDGYVQSKMKQMGLAVCRQLAPTLPPDSVDMIINNALQQLAHLDHLHQPPQNVRLVLRHDCQSTGCGDASCTLCQYNPSRLCTRNLKVKYLIDDHLRAKCNAPLRIELVDEQGTCVTDGLPKGVQLELNVLNGEKYKELCPDNTLLSMQQIRGCIISHHTRALLKREGQPDEQLKVYLPLERGQAPLSDLAVTTSSEALLSGKAPTFRLLVWAVDSHGEPVQYVTYVVSESFVVATKRVKGAIKSDIPSVQDSIQKLMHIGKATVDKLQDIRVAAREEGFEIAVPDHLNRIEKVGQFVELLRLGDANADVKNKVRHLLKLSPEKWDEVVQHAMQAVVPDYRPRVWWYPAINGGLMFQCKNGAVQFDTPTALVKFGPAKDAPPRTIPLSALNPSDQNMVPKLKNMAIGAWYQPNHPGWAIFSPEGGDQLPAAPRASLGMQQAAPAPQMNGGNFAQAAMQQNPLMGLDPIPAPPASRTSTGSAYASTSPFANAPLLPSQGPGQVVPPHATASAQAQHQMQQQQQMMSNLMAAGMDQRNLHQQSHPNLPVSAPQPGGPTLNQRSPFAAPSYMGTVADAFPQGGGPVPDQSQIQPLNTLDMLFKTEDFQNLNFPVGPDMGKQNSMEWLTGAAGMQGMNSLEMMNAMGSLQGMNSFQMMDPANLLGPPEMDGQRQLTMSFTNSLDLKDVEQAGQQPPGQT